MSANTYVVIDSNLLHGRLDPDKSRDFNAVIERARSLGWKIAIPCPVKDELVQGAKEGIAKLVEKASPLSHVSEDWRKIDLKTCLENYRSNLDRFLNEHSIDLIPFPKMVTVEELFSLSLGKAPPFDKRDGMRDPVVFFSVLEFARSTASSVFLVGQDGPFVAAAKRYSERPKTFEVLTYDEMIEKMNGLMATRDQATTEKVKKQIEDLVARRTGEIEKVVATGVEAPTGFITVYGARPQYTLRDVNSIDYLYSTPTGMSFLVHTSGSLSLPNRYNPLTLIQDLDPTQVGLSQYSAAVVVDAKLNSDNTITESSFRPVDE